MEMEVETGMDFVTRRPNYVASNSALVEFRGGGENGGHDSAKRRVRGLAEMLMRELRTFRYTSRRDASNFVRANAFAQDLWNDFQIRTTPHHVSLAAVSSERIDALIGDLEQAARGLGAAGIDVGYSAELRNTLDFFEASSRQITDGYGNMRIPFTSRVGGMGEAEIEINGTPHNGRPQLERT